MGAGTLICIKPRELSWERSEKRVDQRPERRSARLGELVPRTDYRNVEAQQTRQVNRGGGNHNIRGCGIDCHFELSELSRGVTNGGQNPSDMRILIVDPANLRGRYRPWIDNSCHLSRLRSGSGCDAPGVLISC